jgi:hypothetical protein
MTSPNTNHPRPAGSFAVAGLAVVALCVGGWLVLRQPAWRADLCDLVPHRYPIQFALDRQVLAPRSIALAGAGLLGILGGCMAVPAGRRMLLAPIGTRDIFVAVFVLMQFVIAGAVVVNLNAYFLRRFHAPVGRVSGEEILTYWIPQAWPHSKELLRDLPPGAKVALRAGDGTFNRYLLSSLSFPVLCYGAYPANPDDWTADAEFAGLARAEEIDYLLDYHPLDTSMPLRLKRLN